MKMDLGVGPMSIEVIDAVIEYANRNQQDIMLIASRNQIECQELGGGYVGGLTSEGFASYVRERDTNKRIMICRDHSGPFLRAGETQLGIREATEMTKRSLHADIVSGFDLLHIDTSACPDPYESARELFDYALSLKAVHNPDLKFEFGSEENVGVSASPAKFEHDVKFVKSILTPEYVVGQTGTLVKSVYQVGSFDEQAAIKLVRIADEHGVRLKEHNVDYTSEADIQRRRELGVGAINVAPEFGYLQTRTVLNLAENTPVSKQYDAFFKHVLEQGKWRKWEWGEFSDAHKVLSSGHYCFMSEQYQELVYEIGKHLDVNAAIKYAVYRALNHYTGK